MENVDRLNGLANEDESSERGQHVRLYAILCVFFLSGAAALIYEISWSRQIGIYFGHTVHAASITLATFFAGMTVGYLLAARLAGRVRPLVGYAIAEIIAATWALGLPWLIGIFDHPNIQSQIHETAWSALAIRATVCFLLLLPATTALGATLPFMAEFMSPRRVFSPGRISFAYGLNTTGALVGVLLGTYVLISWLGVVNSSWFAAALSAACGVVALAIARSSADVGDSRHIPSLPQKVVAANPTAEANLLFWYFIAALSGFVTMGLQVTYVRMFALVFHNSSYTFGAVIAVFLAALAIGSFLVAKLHRRFAPAELAGWCSAAGAAVVGLSSFFFVRVTKLAFFDYGDTFLQHIAGALGLVAVVVIGPILLLGTLLPLSWKAASQTADAQAGSSVGSLTAVNTICAAAGSLLTSFVLLPIFGVWSTVAVLAAAAALPAGVLFQKQLPRLGMLGVAIAATIAIGVFEARSASTLPAGASAEIVQSWDSPYGLIDVIAATEGPRFLVLRENIHYQHGDTGPSRRREYRQANLPLLMHPSPKSILFLGMGTGLTAGASLEHPETEEVHVVELIPEVVDAARLFDNWNHDLLNDPRTYLHVDDARHFLRSTTTSFDVIVSDLFVPWQSQTGYLYTREHYQSAIDCLASDGIFCQWLGLYQLGEAEFEMIADTFASVFPHTGLWWGRVSQGMIALVGSNQPLTLSGNDIQRRLAVLPDANRQSPNFDPYLADVPGIFRLYVGQWNVRDEAVLNTDEHPRIEFQMPVTYRNRGLLRGKQLLEYFDSRLSTLPDGDVIFTPADGDTQESPARRRAMQRSVMARAL